MYVAQLVCASPLWEIDFPLWVFYLVRYLHTVHQPTRPFDVFKVVSQSRSAFHYQLFYHVLASWSHVPY